jgi:predicted enzyme related to lactoylglutathione lyase
LAIYLPAKFGKDLVHVHQVSVPFETGALWMPELAQLYGLFAHSAAIGPAVGGKQEVRFPFLPHLGKYELFAIYTPAGTIVFMQGYKEQFRVSVAHKGAGLEFELAYESTNWWKEGLFRMQWAGVVRKFDRTVEALMAQIKESGPSLAVPGPSLLVGPVEEVSLPSRPSVLAAFEIPVADLERATWFYKGVFGFEFTTYRKGLFWISHFGYAQQPFMGALIFGHGYIPQPNGALAFIPVQLMGLARQLVLDHGGQLVANYVNANGNEITKFIDSEGNMAALLGNFTQV